MTLNQLKDALQQILDDFPDIDEAPVKVEQWDDNVYDGIPIEGLRVVYDIEAGDDENGGMTVFIIHR